MFIQEQWCELNKVENQIGEVDYQRILLGDSDYYEPYTDNIGKLFLNFQREYGRCVSKVYIDTLGGAKPIGWVFQKLRKYTDCNEHYLAETWITLHSAKPTKQFTYHYHYLE